MSAALTGCQYIRYQLDTTVLALHHPAKADDSNERGGSGFRRGCADVLGIEEKQGVFWLVLILAASRMHFQALDALGPDGLQMQSGCSPARG